MVYPYRSLSPSLHETADAAIGWFIKKWGLTKTHITVEAAFDPDIQFRPTFVAATSDFHILCVEVSESIYSNTLDSVVIHCREKGLPVKRDKALRTRFESAVDLFGEFIDAVKTARI